MTFGNQLAWYEHAMQAYGAWRAPYGAALAGDAGYDLSIHRNPSALAWTEFFRQTFPDCPIDDDTMLTWFANAMMAMHDHVLGVGPLCGDQFEYEMQQRETASGWDRMTPTQRMRFVRTNPGATERWQSRNAPMLAIRHSLQVAGFVRRGRQWSHRAGVVATPVREGFLLRGGGVQQVVSSLRPDRATAVVARVVRSATLEKRRKQREYF